jgi:hypothetical protein
MRPLLPQTAFAARTPTLVYHSRKRRFLVQVLRSIGSDITARSSLQTQRRLLSQTLSVDSAIWTLCKILLHKNPPTDTLNCESPVVTDCHHSLHIQGYIVYVDFELNDSIIFKLTDDTIKNLVSYYESACYSTDQSIDKSEGEKKESMKKEFIEKVNTFVFRAAANSFLNINNDGSGKLLQRDSKKAKTDVLRLLQPSPISPSSISPSSISPNPAPPQNMRWLAPIPEGCLASDTASGDSMPISWIPEPQLIPPPTQIQWSGNTPMPAGHIAFNNDFLPGYSMTMHTGKYVGEEDRQKSSGNVGFVE